MNHVLPWHRQFWPWFLISIPAMTDCACMFTIYLAVTTSDSLVVTADGGVDVETERALAAEKQAALLGMRGELMLDASTGLLSLSLDKLPESGQPRALTLQFSHPAFSGRDFDIELLPSASPSVFIGQRAAPIDERWYLVLEQDDWRLTGVWDDGRGDGNRALLTPRGAR